jgi:hypothetical protein
MCGMGNLLIRLFVIFSFSFIASTHAAGVKDPQILDMRVQKVDSDINRFIAKLKKDPTNSLK